MLELKGISHSLAHSGVVMRRPKTIPRIISGALSSLVLGKPKLRVVEYVINHECQSECIMCYATKYHRPGQTRLSVAEIHDSWVQCEKLGAFMSIILGGEPTIHRELDDIIVALNPWNNIVVLVTNSLLLDEQKIKNFKGLGLSVLHLSLDGPNEQLNDYVRGAKGHFKKVMECLKSAKKSGIKVYFSSCLRKSNKKEYIELLELAKSLGIGVSGALIVNNGRFEERDDERLDEEDRQWLLKVIKKYKGTLRFDWNNNLSGSYECPAGREKFSIALYGDIMSCVANHLSFGNIRQESVATILERMNNFSHFKDKDKRDKCLISFDTEYYRKYMQEVAKAQNLPVSIFEHPVHPAKLVNGKMVE